MKKSIILFVLMLISIGAYSQNPKIDTLPDGVEAKYIIVKIQIFTNDKKSDRKDFEVEIINLATNIHKRSMTGNLFTVQLPYSTTFKIIVGHKDYNYRTMEIDTHAPVKLWILDIDLYLYSGEANSSAGKLKYSEQAKNFVKIE